MNESKFHKHLKNNLFDKIPGFIYDRVETPTTCSGFPDISYSYLGHHGFIELKYIDVEDGPRFQLNTGLSAAQHAWLYKRQRAGGHCWIITGNRSKIYFVPVQAPHIDFKAIYHTNYTDLNVPIVSPPF